MKASVIFKKLFFLPIAILSLFLVLTDCSHDRSLSEAPPEITEEDGSEIFRYQAVVLNISNLKITEENYLGTLGNTSISLHKIDDRTLGFIVPFKAQIGANKLIIRDLGINIRACLKIEWIEFVLVLDDKKHV